MLTLLGRLFTLKERGNKVFVYLASPYSHPDPFVREMRYLWTMKELGGFLKNGVHVYSPIVHCHELAKVADLPRDAGFWESYNFAMLERAQQLWLLMLPGWEQSVGCKAEVAHAKFLGKVLLQIEPKELL